MNKPQPIVTALLAYGMSGEVFHAPLLEAHAGFRLKTIVERRTARSSERYPGVQVVRSVEEVLGDPEIELVVVNTPNEFHFDQASKVMEAGKHVVVEKPFTVTVEEARQLTSRAKEAGRILTVFQNRRWDGGFMTVQEVMKGGKLGRIVEASLHYDRYRNYIQEGTWKEEPVRGSNILYNLGSHMLDQALVLFGMPDYVDARIGIQRTGGKVDDFYDIRLTYPGLLVIVKSSYLVCADMPRFILHGTEGSFVKFGLDPQEEDLKNKKIPGGPAWGVDPEAWWGTLTYLNGGKRQQQRIETEKGSYLRFYDNLHEAIREGRQPAVTAKQAINLMQMIEMAQQSCQAKKAVMVDA